MSGYGDDLELDTSAVDRQREAARSATSEPPPGAGIRRRPSLSPPPRSSGGLLLKLFLLGLLGAGGYGGYFGYCRYQARKKVYALSTEAHELRQKLMQQAKNIGKEDIKQAVMGFASRAGVVVDPASIVVTIEPLTEQNQSKLTKFARQSLSLIGRIKNYRAPKYLVGFSANFTARHGLATVRFSHQRYTYFEWVK